MSEKHTPEALRLADWLDRYPRPWPEFDEAAALLRTQHALLVQSRDALAYHVEQTRPIHRTAEIIAALNEHLDQP